MSGRGIYARKPELVVAILGYLADADRPAPWNETLDTFSGHGDEPIPWKTLENVLYELIAFGAVHRVGKTGRADTRALKLTPLGRAWLERELLPFVGDTPTDPP